MLSNFLPNSFSLVKFTVTTGNGETRFGREEVVFMEKTIEECHVII